MANIFKKIGRALGLVGEEKQESYGGPRPTTSITDTEAGSKYYQTLKDRLAGIGVGPQDYLIDIQDATNPYAQSRTSYLKNYEIPTISNQASARGLGRSTIPVNRISLSSQEAGRDIAEKLAQYDVMNKQTQQQNEYLRRNEINAALAAMGQVGTAQANAANQAAQWTYNDWLMNEQARLANANNLSGLNNLLSLGAGSVIGGLTSPTTSSKAMSYNQANTNSYLAQLEMYRKMLQNPAMVNIS